MTAWRPSASLEMLRDRALLLSQVRQFFAERDVLEVDTPVLSHAANPDAAIDSIHALVSPAGGSEASLNCYLQTSPEFSMKRLLAAGSGPIYQLCHVFRDGESGRWHNPEFTMLEWYRPGFDMQQLMDEVETLMRELLPASSGPAERIDYHTLFRRCTGVDLRRASASEIRRLAADYGVVLPERNPDEGLVEILFDLATESWMREREGVIVHQFPCSQAALARLRDDDPSVALRFEYYYRGVELANGFQELSEPVEQQRRFNAENSLRERLGKPRMPLDEHFIAALRHGLPDCSGVAAGIDRILMLRNRRNEIADVLAFPFSRA
ncbi:MAG: EF-P lysine aminoacylase EpmA [Gammaproteobacteria bacterium]|jgi:elongation factor P--(R)-beta-lysine ligase